MRGRIFKSLPDQGGWVFIASHQSLQASPMTSPTLRWSKGVVKDRWHRNAPWRRLVNLRRWRWARKRCRRWRCSWVHAPTKRPRAESNFWRIGLGSRLFAINSGKEFPSWFSLSLFLRGIGFGIGFGWTTPGECCVSEFRVVPASSLRSLPLGRLWSGLGRDPLCGLRIGRLLASEGRPSSLEGEFCSPLLGCLWSDDPWRCLVCGIALRRYATLCVMRLIERYRQKWIE